MSRRPRASVSGFLAAVIACGLAPVFAQTPEGVSPGAVDRITKVEGRCPTFIWGGVSEAQAYELVVYRLPEKQPASDTGRLDLSASDEVLYSRVPGGATAWQPELADGLDPGGIYVWFVRAALQANEDEVIEAGDWSAARFFSIPAMPSSMEVEQALSVLQRYTSLGAAGNADLGQSASGTRSLESRQSEPRRNSAPPLESLKSVPTAAAAIKGSIPDATGETYGVVGLSASPDGAGIGAVNTAGGPDLVLDGTEDGETDLLVSQSGVERYSTQIEWFNFSNPGTGEIDIYVEGWTNSHEFVGGGSHLTDVDADTLDGTDGAAFATDAEASGLVAAHAASADHDGRYYTETELNTSGTLNAVHWNNLGAVPPGFADGIDDDTAYTIGPGLIIDSGEIRIDVAAFSTRLSRVDSEGVIGSYSSIAIGTDGLGLISYYDATNDDLKVAHCADTTCSSASTATIDSGGNVGTDTSIAIGTDGLGLISYYDATNEDLKVAHCADTTCSSASTATIDSGGIIGTGTSIAIGTDGLGLISYYHAINDDLKVAHCNDTTCSSATIATIDSEGDVGSYSSIAIGTDGLGLISYRDESNEALKIAHCTDTACSTASTATPVADSNAGEYTSIAIGTDGLGLVSYLNRSSMNLKVAHCTDASCSTAPAATIDSGGDVGLYTSITIGTDGLGLIGYLDITNNDLKVAHCADTACSTASTATIDSEGTVGFSLSTAIGTDGLGLISYYESSAGVHLKVAHLGIGVP